mgnify:CR=1 FL=1
MENHARHFSLRFNTPHENRRWAWTFFVLGKQGPCTESEFSNYAEIDQRYAREWLLAMCASGYISHTESVSKFYMSEEQKAVFSFEDSSAFMLGAFDILSGNIHNIDKVRDAFKTGEGINYESTHPCIFSGTARFLDLHILPIYLKNGYRLFRM